MDYEWHEPKRLKVLIERGLDFADADWLFGNECLIEEAQTIEGEARYRAVGLIGNAAVTVVYTMRGSVLRIITMRRAHDREERRYQALLRSRVA